jgi:ABC-type antimicrobial peptide transport system permease subunit
MKRLGLEKENQPQAYMPFEQSPWFFMTFVVRTDGDPLQAVDHIRRAVWAVDPNQAIAWVRPMSEVVSDSIARPRFSMTLLVFFAGIALLLTAVGIYGVMAHSVSQRVQEIGVRLALGARRGDILRLIMGRALALTFVGLAIGLSVAFGLTRLLASFLFRVSTTDPLTFLMLPIFLIGLAMAATYIPARHATRVAPSTALKHE